MIIKTEGLDNWTYNFLLLFVVLRYIQIRGTLSNIILYPWIGTIIGFHIQS